MIFFTVHFFFFSKIFVTFTRLNVFAKVRFGRNDVKKSNAISETQCMAEPAEKCIKILLFLCFSVGIYFCVTFEGILHFWVIVVSF